MDVDDGDRPCRNTKPDSARGFDISARGPGTGHSVGEATGGFSSMFGMPGTAAGFANATRCASSASSASLAPPSRCPCCGRCAPRPPKARQAVARVRGVPRAVPSRPGPLCGRKWPLALRRGTVSPVASRVVWRGFVEQPYCLGQRERLRCGPRPGCCACRRAILHVSRPVSRRLGKEAASDSLCRWRAA